MKWDKLLCYMSPAVINSISVSRWDQPFPIWRLQLWWFLLWYHHYHNNICNLSDGDRKAWAIVIHSQLHLSIKSSNTKENCFITRTLSVLYRQVLATSASTVPVSTDYYGHALLSAILSELFLFNNWQGQILDTNYKCCFYSTFVL